MPALLADTIGWVGALCLLLAYAGLATQRLSPGVAYHVLNLAGGGGLAVNSAYHHAWPSAALNVVWLGIGVVALRGRRRAPGKVPAWDA
jgi:hypothetical protein